MGPFESPPGHVIEPRPHDVDMAAEGRWFSQQICWACGYHRWPPDKPPWWKRLANHLGLC